MIVLAEGAQWHASELTRLINEADNPYDARFTILGYIQRGGAPSRFDRILATRMGGERGRGAVGGGVGRADGVEPATASNSSRATTCRSGPTRGARR